MQAAEYQNYPWKAEDMGRFVTERTQLKPGAIERPSFLKSPMFPVLVLGVLSLGAWLAFKLYYAEFMKNTLIYMVAVIAVYWFSVSGGMYNIIRGVPMQHWDKRSGKVRPHSRASSPHLPCSSGLAACHESGVEQYQGVLSYRCSNLLCRQFVQDARDQS